MTELRADLAIISQWIEPGSRVLDLGCGDGTLLRFLQETRNVSGYGLEIDPGNIGASIRNGVNVLQTDLNAGLSDFDPDSFDYVVMTQTLQAVHSPHRLLEEMLRIGQQGIVTFPNFGYWRLRYHLTLKGRMPMSGALPNTWYQTPNIHLCTLKDFEQLCQQQGIRILQRMVLDHRHHHFALSRLLPNLLGEVAMYRFRRG
jgi:methionine biosynthesis protein MetW